jgi:hypothetical protein
MNNGEKFEAFIDNPLDLFKPGVGDHVLLVHLSTLFPCTHLEYSPRVIDDIVLSNVDFIDDKCALKELKRSQHKLMWHIDSELRSAYESEALALEKIAAAHDAYMLEDGTPSDDLKTYDLLFDLVAPIYEPLRRMNQFTFENFFCT